jgi:hypothetical protein
MVLGSFSPYCVVSLGWRFLLGECAGVLLVMEDVGLPYTKIFDTMCVDGYAQGWNLELINMW